MPVLTPVCMCAEAKLYLMVPAYFQVCELLGRAVGESLPVQLQCLHTLQSELLKGDKRFAFASARLIAQSLLSRGHCPPGRNEVATQYLEEAVKHLVHEFETFDLGAAASGVVTIVRLADCSLDSETTARLVGAAASISSFFSALADRSSSSLLLLERANDMVVELVPGWKVRSPFRHSREKAGRGIFVLLFSSSFDCLV
jgi:hypothetical protein